MVIDVIKCVRHIDKECTMTKLARVIGFNSLLIMNNIISKSTDQLYDIRHNFLKIIRNILSISMNND